MKNRLKVLRAERDWSQADLADRLEVSRQTVNARYRRKRKVSLRHIPYPAWLTRPAC